MQAVTLQSCFLRCWSSVMKSPTFLLSHIISGKWYNAQWYHTFTFTFIHLYTTWHWLRACGKAFSGADLQSKVAELYKTVLIRFTETQLHLHKLDRAQKHKEKVSTYLLWNIFVCECARVSVTLIHCKAELALPGLKGLIRMTVNHAAVIRELQTLIMGMNLNKFC